MLKTQKAVFAGLCKNGQCVLFAETGFKQFPIFVDLDAKEAVYHTHEVASYTKQVINKTSGEIWHLDLLSEQIWKISSQGSSLMGTLENSGCASLVHVDQSYHLYLV